MSLDELVQSLVMQSPLSEIRQYRLDRNILPRIKSAFEIARTDVELLSLMLDDTNPPEERLKAVGEGIRKMVGGQPRKVYWENRPSFLLALSVMNYLCTQLYQKDKDKLVVVFGNSFDNREMDANYRGGVNDYTILFETIQGRENPEIFFDKSRDHLHRSREIWERTKEAHAGIAYRNARAGDVYWHLYKLSRNGDYLTKARKLMDETDSIRSSCLISERDLEVIENIRKRVLSSN